MEPDTFSSVEKPPTPSPIRSPSGAFSRPPSSPHSMRRGSRGSLGGGTEDHERRLTPKRSISNLISGLRDAQSAKETIEEVPPMNAAAIASQHFFKELQGHASADKESENLVIIHDACYGHRYSRLKTTKSTLSMIVERPERIHACVLGLAAAYVRLGGHHSGAKNHPTALSGGESQPPFKIRRSSRAIDITSSYVTNVHGTAWMSELRALCGSAGERLASGTNELARSAAMPGAPAKRDLHEGDLYLSPESLAAFQGALGGVADAVDAVFDPAVSTKQAFVAVRPPGHHCSAQYPAGFCWLNNVHVGIEYAAQHHGLTHAAILDFDLHHGDGSQSIAWQRNSRNNIKRLNAKPTSKLKLEPDIGYYSIHDINSYPCETGDDEKVTAASLCIENAHGQNTWNVHFQPWKTEAEFWRLYEDRYRVLLDKAGDFLRHHTARLKSEGKVPPKAAIFISAGFDASEWEGSGMQRHKVNVPTEFYARFTRDVVALSRTVDSGCDGRVISVLEGGYSDRALCSGVLSHLSGLCARPVNMTSDGVGSLMELSEQMNELSLLGLGLGLRSSTYYDQEWWSAANLTALELQGQPPPPAAKKARATNRPTYATPTESFAYKVVDPARFARSISGTMQELPAPPRAATPAPVDVDWVVATQELSKLLTPSHRQTKSCTPEELGGVRVKKEVPAAPKIDTAVVSQSRQLRDRKAAVKGPVYENGPSDFARARSASRSSRRETIDVIPSAEDTRPAAPSRRTSRRLSAGNIGMATAEADPLAPPVPALPPTAISDMLPVKKTRHEPQGSYAAKRASNGNTQVNPTSNGTGPASSNDVESLTSAIKKVTLKVSGSKEEHDRKQKEKTDAERRARALKAAETRRANAAAKKAAKESGINAAPTKVANPIGSSVDKVRPNGTGTVDSTTGPSQHELQKPESVELPEAAPGEYQLLSTEAVTVHPTVDPDVNFADGPRLPTLSQAPAMSAGVQVETHETPETGSIHVPPETTSSTVAAGSTMAEAPISIISGPSEEHDQSLPPALSPATTNETISPPPKASQVPLKSRLPVWSSTGTIPFASLLGYAASGPLHPMVSKLPSELQTNEVKPEESHNGSIWDVPESPAS